MIFRYFHSAAEAAPAEGLGGDPAPRDDPRLPLHHRQQQGRVTDNNTVGGTNLSNCP